MSFQVSIVKPPLFRGRILGARGRIIGLVPHHLVVEPSVLLKPFIQLGCGLSVNWRTSRNSPSFHRTITSTRPNILGLLHVKRPVAAPYVLCHGCILLSCLISFGNFCVNASRSLLTPR